MFPKKIIAICGSTRKESVNLSLIKAIQKLAAGKMEITLFHEIATLPHFNPDHDTDQPPAPVKNFREQLRAHDAILICTPEYAMGVPGTLKNAIDWTVSSMEFSKKPVALITASSQGQKAHVSLLETLKIIESAITGETALLIPFAKTKIDTTTNEITDAATLIQVENLLNVLYQML